MFANRKLKPLSEKQIERLLDPTPGAGSMVLFLEPDNATLEHIRRIDGNANPITVGGNINVDDILTSKPGKLMMISGIAEAISPSIFGDDSEEHF